MPGAPRQLTAEDLANLSNSNHHHRGINSDAAKAQREKHLTATFTTRDLFGICRGACTSCDTRGCPGGYLKATRDYGKDALEEEHVLGLEDPAAGGVLALGAALALRDRQPRPRRSDCLFPLAGRRVRPGPLQVVGGTVAPVQRLGVRCWLLCL